MPEVSEQELRDMNLHDVSDLGPFLEGSLCITRVVGGWIYWQFHGPTEGIHSSYSVAGVFVPEP